jgi:hypothetical protein
VSQETAADDGVGSPTRVGLVFALKQGPLRFTELFKAVPG